ncbi:phosphate ABC transporter permease subunit PstC [Ignicoccus islandicus]|nr:phosphate ABC transporter permease subunit PstC [Ignicoccus islandicus]
MKKRLKPPILVSFGGLLLLVVFISALLPIAYYSTPFILEKGYELLTSSEWNPSANKFGAIQFILGSLWVTFWSTLLTLPLSVSMAVFAAELAPKRLKTLVGGLVDLIAAVPSVVYGYWGLMIFGPLMATYFYPTFQSILSNVPLISTLVETSSITPQCFMTAVLVLSLMMIPYASAIIRNSYEMIPKDLKEAVYALGGDQWDVIKIGIGYVKSSIVAGTIIAAGRALGETMAVTMLIGNSIGPFKPCLLCRGATITSLVANEFEEAMMNPLHSEALTTLILILVGMGFALLYFGRKVSKNFMEVEASA